MLRNMSSDSSSSRAGHGVASPGLDGQESSWIGLLSRPAMAFLQRYLPGRPRTPIRSDAGAAWILGGGLKTSFVDEEREFLRQLDDMMPLQHPASHLTHLRCQHDGAAGLLEPRGGGALPWLTADSLLEMGIQTSEELDLNLCQQTQIGYLSSVRTFFSHVLLSSVSLQEIKPTVEPVGAVKRTWWGSFWPGEESSQKGPLSDASCLCPQQPAAETKAPETTDLFVQRWTLGENAGPADLKEEPSNNGGLQTVQNAEGSTTTDRRLAIGGYLSRSGAAAACSEVALLTPDQDNGYSSLEEEHFQVSRLSEPKAPSEEQEAGSAEIGAAMEMEEETPAEGESTAGNVDEEEEEEEREAESVEAAALPNPECQNKAIAFIMGCPCSDDDSSQSDGESSDDDDDDDDAGFDSEGLSDESDSTDDEEEDDEEDDEASDSEVDSEAERLWSSLCRSVDPYNPRNFTARLHTSTSAPRSIPAATPPSSACSTLASSPDLAPLPLSSSSPPLASSSPQSGSDFWDDSTSASEADEAESLRLLSSFSCSADPYSPFNFQATLRTQGPVVEAAGPKTKARKAPQTPSCLLRPKPASPPEYRREEVEERLDSGFSEPATSSQRCSATKKVRFRDDVEEFFASCGEEEDRRGPWEQLARDRCRFLRRCQEVEQSIGFCLTPPHRQRVYRRLGPVLHGQDA